MIERDPPSAEKNRYDLIIVGGGIYGACLALESAQRGLRPLLLERRDFGGGASAQTLRIIHGGLRYLQSMDLRRFRRSVEQRRWWLGTFPTLVHPMPCLMPLDGRGVKRRGVLRLALSMNDLLSADRNHGLPPESRIPRGRILSPRKTRELFPGCNPDGLQGGALWYDGSMVSPQRLVMEVLRWACMMGGTALNYVSVHELAIHGGRVRGVRALDEVAGTNLEFSAPVVVNAAGSAAERLRRTFDPHTPELFQRSLAFNVLLSRELPASMAIGVSAPSGGGRTYFLRPWGELTLAGTVHTEWKDSGVASPTVSEALLQTFLSDLGETIPEFAPSLQDVVRIFAGFLPSASSQSAEPMTHPVVLDHQEAGGLAGLYSVSGVKFTTSPAVARRVLDRIFGPGGSDGSWSSVNSRPAVRSWPAPPLTLAGTAEGKKRLTDALPDLRRIVQEEAVMFADDLIRRRLDWGMSAVDLEAMARELHRLLPEIPVGVGVENASSNRRGGS